MDIKETLIAKHVFSVGGEIVGDTVTIPIDKFPELITLIENRLLESQEPIGEVLEDGVKWSSVHPEKHKLGTKFYVKPAEKLNMRYMNTKRRHDRMIAIASELLDKGNLNDHLNDLSKLVEESKL